MVKLYLSNFLQHSRLFKLVRAASIQLSEKVGQKFLDLCISAPASALLATINTEYKQWNSEVKCHCLSAMKYLSLLTPAEVSWSACYVTLAWLAQLGNGAIQTITGPMQPYLAYNLKTDTQTINLVWTLGFSGFLIGSLFTSNIFTKYLTTSQKKLSFMSFVLFLTGVSTLMMPFMYNLPMLLLCRFVQVKSN